MKGWLFLFFVLIVPCQAVTIDVAQDKQVLLIDETLTVRYTIHFPGEKPPQLFSFLYALNHNPMSDFQLLSSKVDQIDSATLALSFTLAPLTTGELIFAPGVLPFADESYLVPAVRVEALTTGLSMLPIARMLPLYPERRIELSPEMRLKLMSQDVLEKAEGQIVTSFEQHDKAWNMLLVALIGIPCSLLFMWGLIYYELLQRRLRPLAKEPSKLEQLMDAVGSPNWQKLSELLKEVLGSIGSENYHILDYREIHQKVATSSRFSNQEQHDLLQLLQTLTLNAYAAKPESDEEWHKARELVFALLKKYLLNKSHHDQNR